MATLLPLKFNGSIIVVSPFYPEVVVGA
jgi:hypothetical protein